VEAGSDYTALWASPSVRARIEQVVPSRRLKDLSEIDPHDRTLIVAGGGTWIDEAKYIRATQRPELRLIAIPTIFGSGAERSPIVVLNRAAAKEIHVGTQFLPDAVVYWHDLLKSVSVRRARYGCGDAWAHALEAFFSPIASSDLRIEASSLIRHMLELPLQPDPRWFEASAGACALQAASSVGLVHGIAHTIEPAISGAEPPGCAGHSRICASFLFPVLGLNGYASSKPEELCRKHEVDFAAILGVARDLFEPDFYRWAMPTVGSLWPSVLRDRCTRTNVALIRSSHLGYLEKVS
jgi:alcohol dehydrogenase class IV